MPEGGEYRQKTITMGATKPQEAGRKLAELI
jgi:hypothetical protein